MSILAEDGPVCYLQILLADTAPGAEQERLLADLHGRGHGHRFRLGSAKVWFARDAE